MIISLLLTIAEDRNIFFQDSLLTSAQFARVANSLISVGEAKAAKFLIDESQSKSDLYAGTRNIRACHMARLLFRSKGDQPLRAPMLGGTDLPRYSMPITDWPDLPFVQQNGFYFELTESYLLAGGPGESCAGYIAYCQKEGKFRSDTLKVPSVSEAKKAYDDLLSSPRWKNIRWSYSSPSESYQMTPGFILDRLKFQIDK